MGLLDIFNKFTETIFYKNDSELEFQIEALKKLHEEYPKNEIISQKLKLCELGLAGENEIEFELKNANIGMYVLHDVNLQFEDLKAQVDYILITPANIYFVECKNLIGNITVNNRGEFIREYSLGNKKIKEGFYSPITQSDRHRDIYKKIWKSRNTGILSNYYYNHIDSWCKSLVVMSNSKNILNVKYAPKEIRNKIVRSDNLVKYIINDINHADKDTLSNKKDMEQIASRLMESYNVKVQRNYYEEYSKFVNNSNTTNSLITNNNSSLREKLINFRKNRSQEKNIPAYYVFTNDELNKLVELKPKTINELKSSGILSQIKINTHGNYIIKIINS